MGRGWTEDVMDEIFKLQGSEKWDQGSHRVSGLVQQKYKSISNMTVPFFYQYV